MLDVDKLLPEVNEAIEDGTVESVEALLQTINSNDIAYILSYINAENFSPLLSLVIKHRKGDLSEIVPELSHSMLNEFFRYCYESNLNDLVREMFNEVFNDDVVDILSVIDSDLGEWIQRQMDQGDYDETIPLLNYPEESAGRIMSTDMIAVPEHSSVGETLEVIREQGEQAETVHSIYIIDGNRTLTGVLSLRELLFKPLSVKMADIMKRDVISIQAEEDREKAARTVEHYNLSALPVTDRDGRLEGIITVDDVIDIIRAETTEDIMRQAGSKSDDLYERSSWKSFKHRVPWLFVAFLGGMVTVKVMGKLTGIIPNAAFLAFVPVIVGMSGNIANQSSTILVRGLATGKIHMSRLWQVLIRELVTALMLGFVFAALLFISSSIEFSNIPFLSSSVSLAIIFSMLIAAMFATVLPMLFFYLSIDPAVATGPFVTVSIDILGIFVYILTIDLITSIAI